MRASGHSSGGHNNGPYLFGDHIAVLLDVCSIETGRTFDFLHGGPGIHRDITVFFHRLDAIADIHIHVIRPIAAPREP